MPIDLKEVARTVVRVPVSGPSPNNTLVFVTAKLTGITPTITSETKAEGLAIWETAYQIAGFDQTRAADYLANTKWSVAVTMSYLGSDDDQTFWASVDNVQGHLSIEGQFYVTADLSGFVDDVKVSYNLSMSAYILTEEPQPDFTRPPRRGPTVRDMIQKRPSYIQEQGLKVIGKAALTAPPRKPRRVIDDCR